jgi:ABC-type multidrug transport system fused ATPase/permease subunit
MISSEKLLNYSTYNLVRDLKPYLRPYAGRIIFSTTLRIIGDVLRLYPAYALAETVNFLTRYTSGQSLEPLEKIFVFYCTAMVLLHVAHYCAKMVLFAVSEQIAIDVQLDCIKHVCALDISWHEHENTGSKLKKITRGARSVDRVLRIWSSMLPIAVEFVGALIIIAKFDRTIAAVTLTLMASYYLLARVFRKRAARATIRANAQEEQVEGLLFESLNNIRTIKVLGMANVLLDRLADASKDLYLKIRKRIFWFQTGGYTRSVYAKLFEGIMLAVIAYGVIQGRYEVGFLILFNLYFSKVLSAVSDMAEIAQDYEVAKLSIGRMFEIFNEPVRIDAEEGKVGFPTHWQTISFKNVSFSYGDNIVLDDVSFDIKRGEKVGIVGLSGVGKSTIFKLLLKEYESYTGDIFVDDVPLRDIRRSDYFAHTAVVLQDTEVFNFSLKENITLANPTKSERSELFKKALHVSYVSDFMKRLPKGMNTLIGEKGIRLSGGERQRLGIARAVFKDPQLLLLDEATSHLDIESEEKIRISLHEFFDTVTAVVIAHRLTTIKEMDTIIVLENGKILETGSFEELHTRKSRFYELWEKQNL